MNAILNVGILVSTFLLFVAIKSRKANLAKQTQITLRVSDNASAKGSIPYIAVWDKDGKRVTQFKGDKNSYIGYGID
jgi:hypothetical protein